MDCYIELYYFKNIDCFLIVQLIPDSGNRTINYMCKHTITCENTYTFLGCSIKKNDKDAVHNANFAGFGRKLVRTCFQICWFNFVSLKCELFRCTDHFRNFIF